MDKGVTERSLRTVLVVEDESIIRLLLADELEAFGFHVLEASSADSAIEMLSDGRTTIDAVVTDVRMPGRMDGLDLARWMYARGLPLPLIVTSGYVSIEEATTANPSVARVVSKPYRASELASDLAALLQIG